MISSGVLAMWRPQVAFYRNLGKCGLLLMGTRHAICCFILPGWVFLSIFQLVIERGWRQHLIMEFSEPGKRLSGYRPVIQARSAFAVVFAVVVVIVVVVAAVVVVVCIYIYIVTDPVSVHVTGHL